VFGITCMEQLLEFRLWKCIALTCNSLKTIFATLKCIWIVFHFSPPNSLDRSFAVIWQHCAILSYRLLKKNFSFQYLFRKRSSLGCLCSTDIFKKKMTLLNLFWTVQCNGVSHITNYGMYNIFNYLQISK